jgi:hypothetical protein
MSKIHGIYICFVTEITWLTDLWRQNHGITDLIRQNHGITDLIHQNHGITDLWFNMLNVYIKQQFADQKHKGMYRYAVIVFYIFNQATSGWYY